MRRSCFLLFLPLFCSAVATAQNPFLPLWEHIPDGEPYVFDDPDRPGHQRLYLYGSHDELRTAYCGRDQVVWSAPVEDLTRWRYDGVSFQTETHDVLYAPDVVETVEDGQKVYYLTPNNQAGGRQSMIARATRPDGPFTVVNWRDSTTTFGLFGFDPAIFRDDDGRVYGYWGFQRSYAAELDPTTMCTLRPGTEVVTDMVSSHKQAGPFRFFEASSMRKIMGKYVFIYSRITEDGEFGLPSTNYTLAYAYADRPLGPFTYGGTLIDARARGRDPEGRVIATASHGGNTHGSLAKVGRQWYLFYHRMTGTTQFARQAMVAPVSITLKDGRLVISEAEYTSEGFALEGLDPYRRHAAGIACYYTGGAYPKATYADHPGYDASLSLRRPASPMTGLTAGTTIGYKYFRFQPTPRELVLTLTPEAADGEVEAVLDDPYSTAVIGRAHIGQATELTIGLAFPKGTKGKHALYLRFLSPTKGRPLCELNSLMFR